MKKIVLSLAVIASVALVSCNNTNTQQNAETTTKSAAPAFRPVFDRYGAETIGSGALAAGRRTGAVFAAHRSGL